MRTLWIGFALALAACSPPPPPEAPAAEAPAAAPVTVTGPYTNSWDAAEFSSFSHDLEAASGGVRRLRLEATTDASGGETVAVYRRGPDGQRMTGWRLFVIADLDGTIDAGELEFPAVGEGEVSRVPVVVVIENAGGRRHAGSYTLTVE